MNYFIVDAFTDKPFGGNPAGVVLLDSGSFPKEDLMLKIAAELRYSETAFVRRDGEKEFTIRYFTPKAEVELCGHATIASFFLLHKKGLASGQCLCHTKAGDLTIEAGDKVLMQMAKPRIVATVEDTEEIYKALGMYGQNMFCPYCSDRLRRPPRPHDSAARCGNIAVAAARHGGYRCHHKELRCREFPRLRFRRRRLHRSCPRLRAIVRHP